MLKRYIQNAGIIGIAEVVLRLKGLLLMPILTRAFGAVNYGIWAQVSVITCMLIPLMVMGTDSALLRFLPGKDEKEIQRGFSTALFYYVLVSLFVSGLLWICSQPIAAAFFDDVADYKFVILCGGVILSTLLTGVCRNYFRIRGNGKAFAAVNIIQCVYTVIIGLVVVILSGTVFDVVLLGFIADLLFSIILISLIMARHGFAWPERSVFVNFLKFGMPLMPAGYAMWALNGADRLFIAHYGSMQDLGVYSVVYGLGYMIIALVFTPIWVMYPTAASELYNQGQLKQLSRLYRHSTRLALALLVPAIVGVSILGAPIIRLLSTEEFVRGASLVPLIMLAYTFHMFAAYYAVALGLVGRQVWSTINTGIAACINILLNFLLIPIWGITGAAVATLIGFGAQFFLTSWMGNKSLSLQFDWRFFGKVCSASAGMGVVLLFLPAGASLWLVVPYMAIGVSVYVAAMLMQQAVNTAEKEVIIEVLNLKVLRRFYLFRLLFNVE